MSIKRISSLPTSHQWPFSLTLYGDANFRPFRNLWMLEELGCVPYEHVSCLPRSRVARSVHPLGKIPALVVKFTGDSGGDTKLTFDGKAFDSRRQNDEVAATGEEGATNTSTTVMYESAAINTYLGDLTREHHHHPWPLSQRRNRSSLDVPPSSPPPLVPAPASSQRAAYESLLHFLVSEMDAQALWIHRKHASDVAPMLGGQVEGGHVVLVEARGQFERALGAVENTLGGVGEEAMEEEDSRYLLSEGFSAVDIFFVHCCNWAQSIGWLATTRSSSESNEGDTGSNMDSISNNNMAIKDGRERRNANIVSTKEAERRGAEDVTLAIPLSPTLEKYLTQCRTRPAYVRTNELIKEQQQARQTMKLKEVKVPSSKL